MSTDQLPSNGLPAQPRHIGRQFVRCYYTILNRSPLNLYCFYNDDALFIHDDVDPHQHETISAVGKEEIRKVMEKRTEQYRHTTTYINSIDTVETIDNGMVIQISGDISYNNETLRPFNQTFILEAKTPFKFYVQNEIFRYNDFISDGLKRRSSSVSGHFVIAGENIGVYNVIQSTAQIELNDSANDESDEISKKDQADLDMQSINLKNLLSESRFITKESIKRVASPPNVNVSSTNSESGEQSIGSMNASEETNNSEISENQNNMFFDKCILTIGNVVNPNIQFDNENGLQNNAEPENVESETIEKPAKETTDNNNNVVLKSSKKRKSKHAKKKRASISPPNVDSEASQSGPSPKPCDETEAPSKPESENEMVPTTEFDVVEVNVNEKTNRKSKNRKRQKQSEKLNDNPTAEPEPVNEVGVEPEEIVKEAEPEPKTYANLVKKTEKEHDNGIEWTHFPNEHRDSSAPKERIKSMSFVSTARKLSRNDKLSPPTRQRDSPHGQKFSQGNDLLQVFIGNVPHSACEDDLRNIFSRFGRLTRCRIHANNKKSFLPNYAFINYDNIESVRKCLKNRNSFYFPETGRDSLKLNVNGDPSIDIEAREPTATDFNRKRRDDLKQFQTNFIMNDETNGSRQDAAGIRRPSSQGCGIETVSNAKKDQKPSHERERRRLTRA